MLLLCEQVCATGSRSPSSSELTSIVIFRLANPSKGGLNLAVTKNKNRLRLFSSSSSRIFFFLIGVRIYYAKSYISKKRERIFNYKCNLQ
jgi:hypothetical protein